MNYLDCYIRVSTKEQAEDGDSLNSQIKVGKSVAKKLNLKFRLRNEGARSSTIHYREVFEELKDDIKQGKVTHVWCLDRSRMFRDMIDSMMFRKEYLERYKVRLFESQFAREVQFRDEFSKAMGKSFSNRTNRRLLKKFTVELNIHVFNIIIYHFSSNNI